MFRMLCEVQNEQWSISMVREASSPRYDFLSFADDNVKQVCSQRSMRQRSWDL